ncbi:hypothetical protein PTTG_09395, partial [Puccinia triticina 1-1 BBBD Race 1]
MLASETFSQYKTRARTLQWMINFKQHSLSDFQLAEGMAFGLPTKLENEVNKLDLLKCKEFKFKEFIRRVGNCYDALPKKTYCPRAGAANTSSQQNPNIGNVPREEYIWQIHSYLDSVGKCHHSAVADDGEAPQDGLADIYDNTDFEEYHVAAIATLNDIKSSLADKMNTRIPTPYDNPSAYMATTEILDAEHHLFAEGEALILEHPAFDSLLLNRVEGEFSKENYEEF